MNPQREMRKFRAVYIAACTDEVMLASFVNIADDVITGKWPDDTPLDAAHIVGDLRAIDGWWCSDEIHHQLFSVLGSRMLRQVFINEFGTAPDALPLEVGQVVLTLVNDFQERQFERVHSQLRQRLVIKFGDKVPDRAQVEQYIKKEQLVVEQFMKGAAAGELPPNRTEH